MSAELTHDAAGAQPFSDRVMLHLPGRRAYQPSDDYLFFASSLCATVLHLEGYGISHSKPDQVCGKR